MMLSPMQEQIFVAGIIILAILMNVNKKRKEKAMGEKSVEDMVAYITDQLPLVNEYTVQQIYEFILDNEE